MTTQQTGQDIATNYDHNLNQQSLNCDSQYSKLHQINDTTIESYQNSSSVSGTATLGVTETHPSVVSKGPGFKTTGPKNDNNKFNYQQQDNSSSSSTAAATVTAIANSPKNDSSEPQYFALKIVPVMSKILMSRVLQEVKVQQSVQNQSRAQGSVLQSLNYQVFHSNSNSQGQAVLFQALELGHCSLHKYMFNTKKDFLKGNNRKLSISKIERIFDDMTTALIQVHQKNIVHLDVKLDNYLLCGQEYRVKLGDFGLSRKFRKQHDHDDDLNHDGVLSRKFRKQNGYHDDNHDHDDLSRKFRKSNDIGYDDDLNHDGDLNHDDHHHDGEEEDQKIQNNSYELPHTDLVNTEGDRLLLKRRVGTIRFMSPEVLWNPSKIKNNVNDNNKFNQQYSLSVGTRSDVWSLGVCFYLCLYGRFPYSATNENSVTNVIVAITDFRSVVEYNEADLEILEDQDLDQDIKEQDNHIKDNHNHFNHNIKDINQDSEFQSDKLNNSINTVKSNTNRLISFSDRKSNLLLLLRGCLARDEKQRFTSEEVLKLLRQRNPDLTASILEQRGLESGRQNQFSSLKKLSLFDKLIKQLALFNNINLSQQQQQSLNSQQQNSNLNQWNNTINTNNTGKNCNNQEKDTTKLKMSQKKS